MKLPLQGLLAALLCLAGGPALAQIHDLGAAINQAGRERMLSQRLAKAYFQIGLQVEVERSRKILDASVAQFDRQLVELKNYAPTPDIRDTYLKLEKVWLAYKDLLIAREPSPASGRQVLEISEQVLALAHQGTTQLETLAPGPAGRLVDLSGRQRMLSQRLAKLYQARAWGIAAAGSAAELEAARKEFSAAHQELAAASANGPQIAGSLELVKQQWFFFENALGQRGDRRALAAVATSSERILEEMEGLVGLYEKLGR